MATTALILWGIYYVVVLAARVALHLRRTGQTGLPRGRRRPVQAVGEVVEFMALALALAAPVMAALGDAGRIEALDGPVGHALGIALFVAGLAGIAWSQEVMGDSWRIGVDPDSRSDLVTRGPFAAARNPIYTCLVLVVAGSALLVPNALALAAVALIVVSVEIQTRLVEEPHLLRTHGSEYRAYASRVGRFVPGVGRLDAARFAEPRPG